MLTRSQAPGALERDVDSYLAARAAKPARSSWWARLRGRGASRSVGPAAEPGAVSVHGVEKSFGRRKVVDGASLHVRRGEAVGLLGPNGAGKTTIFYMITGLLHVDRGRIELDAHDITGLPMYQRAR